MNSHCKRVCLKIIGITVLSLCACSANKKDKEDRDSIENTSTIVAFCKSIDYTDTASLHKDKTMAILMRNLIIQMKNAHPAEIAESLDIFFNGVKNDNKTLRAAVHYADLYLGNPDSPVRDDITYIQFLEVLLNVSGIPEDLTARSNEQLRKARLNHRGTIANDFNFIDRNGEIGSLHKLTARQTILIFYDPECPHCPEILERIAKNPKVNEKIKDGTVTVLAVYTEGKREVWENTKADLPDQWIVAYDQTGILDADLYDIPAMPTVYLLDADKRVLIKDMRW